MNYLGEVNELPQTANEGDVCAFVASQTLDLIASGLSEITNGFVALGYGDLILSLATGSSEQYEILNTVANFITGSTSLQEINYNEPKIIKLNIDDTIYTLTVTRFSYGDDGAGYRIDL